MKSLFNILPLLLIKTLTCVLGNQTTVSIDFGDQTLKTTSNNLFNTFSNDTIALESETTNWLSDGQRTVTDRPSTLYVTQRRTTNPTVKYTETEKVTQEKITQTHETSSGEDDNLTSPSMAAVYEDEKSSTDGMEQHESVTSKSLLTTYADKSEVSGSKSRHHSEICDFCLYEGEGNFTSYGYPLNYRNNLNCTYRIMRIDEDVCEVEIFFHDFDIPVSSLPSTAFQSSKTTHKEKDCREDYLEVDGHKYCGSGWTQHSEVISFPSNQRELVFRFKSNEKTTGRGFWAEVRRRTGSCYGKRLKPQASQICEERFSEIEFEIKSPEFPENYPLNANCAYYIKRANEDVCALELTFFKFDIEMVDGCAYDYLEIDGQKFCGLLPDNSQNIFKFESDEKLISFQTDAQIAKSGFHIHATQITDCHPPSLPAPPSCNVCTSEGFGTLVSYGYPDHYRNNLLCTYTIDRRNDDYCYVEFEFEDFDLQGSDNCEADYLQLEDQRYCRDSLLSTKRTIAFEGRDKGIVLVFKTDSSKTKRGFLIQYKQLECTNDLALEKASSVAAVVPADNRQCDYVFEEKEFMIRSENFSKSYANNLDCSYYVKRNTSKVCYLELTFIMFDIEASPDCQYDYLEVGNTVRLCGTLQTETVRTYIFDEQEKLIKFHSDASTNRNGYLIKAEQLECKGDKIIRKPTPTLTTPSGLMPSSTRHSVEESSYCSHVLEQEEFNIISPNYPNPYAPNLDCLYMIKKISPNICKLDVSFDDFEIQPSDPNSFCKYDFVDFNGIRVCGDVVKGEMRTYFFQKDTFPVHFHSDNSVTNSDRGFRFNVRQSECGTNQIHPVEERRNGQDFLLTDVEPQSCNKMYTETAFELKSPNYPESYPNNLNCRYTIIKKRNDMKICQLEVNFVDMNLEKSNECEKDYLNFNGQLMCGSLPGETTRYYLFDGNEFMINFVSDSFQNDRGFFLRIRQKECPPDSQPIRQPFGNGLAQCGGVYRETSFELKSPQYPDYYENNLDCVYTIKRKNEDICRIELRFIDFDVEPSPGCSYDYLMIDGKKICGDMKTNQMKTIQFYEAEKVLVFRSTTSSNKRGFLIKGQQKECESYPPITQSTIESTIQSTSLSPIPSICELCFTEVMGSIQSYDYPNNYPANLNCKYKITPLPGHCMVQINFEEFNLEGPHSQNCDSDYLEINNVKYCGKQLEGATRVVAFNKNPNQVTVRFITNSQITGRGFRASYTQLPCIGGVPSGHQPLTHHQKTPPFTSSSALSNYGTQHIAIVDSTKRDFDSTLNRIPCDLVIYDMVFEIKSPNYPKFYAKNSDCMFSIRRVNPNICKLKLRFVNFDVMGNDKDCNGDSLEIYGHKICGHIPNNTIKEFAFNSYKTSLRFRSDSEVSAKGFIIRGEQVDCSVESKVSISQQSLDQMRQYSSNIPSQYSSYNPQQSVQSQYPSQISGNYPSVSHPHKPHHSVPPSSSHQSNYYHNPNPQHMSAVTQASPPVSISSPQRPDYSYRSPPSLPHTPHTPHSPSKSFPPPEPSPSQISSHSSYDPYYDRRIPPSIPINPVKPSQSSPQMPSYHSKSNYQQSYNQFQSDRNFGDPSQFSGSSDTQSHRSPAPYQSISPQSHDIPQQELGSAPQPDNQQTPYQRGQTSHNGYKQQISMDYSSQQTTKCDQMIQSMYFEIKSPKAANSQCLYTIQKVKDNICQLDLMFTSFEMGDPTCQQEYLSVDGERLCGDIPKNTIRTYQFNDMFIQMKAQIMTHGKGFDIKGRQVECDSFQMNNQQKSSDSRNPISQSHSTGTSYSSGTQTSSFGSAPYSQQTATHEPSVRGRPPYNQQIERRQRPTNQGFQSNFDGFDTRGPGSDTSALPHSSEITPNAKCNLIFSEIDFTITSPNHPNSYPSNIYCRYTIRKANPNVCAIDMKFNSFEIQDDPKCAKDYLEVDAGRICGVLPPSHERRYYFLPDEYEKVLMFKSDSSGSKPGFSLLVRQIVDCNKPWKPMSASPPTVCDVCSHNLRGQITSSNYPNQYSDYTRCSYRIQAMGPQYCQIRLYLRDIDIETSHSGDCDKDALIIDSERICGKDTNTRDMTLTFPSSEPREVQINFQSDASGSGRGFYIEYVQETCPLSPSPSISQPIGTNLNIFPSDSVQPKIAKPENRTGTLIPPIYPPNYVSRAHIEEIVQTQVQVLDRKDNQTNHRSIHSIVK